MREHAPRRRCVGAALVAVGLGWYLAAFVAAVPVAAQAQGPLPEQVARAVGALLIPAAGMAPAAWGYALLRSGLDGWPRPVWVAGIGVGVGWMVMVPVAGVAAEAPATRAVLALAGLVPALLSPLARSMRDTEAPRWPDPGLLDAPSAWREPRPRRTLLVLVSAFIGAGMVLGGAWQFPRSPQPESGLLAVQLIATGLIVLLAVFVFRLGRSSERYRGFIDAHVAPLGFDGSGGLRILARRGIRAGMVALVVLLGAVGTGGVGLLVVWAASAQLPEGRSARLAVAGAAALAVAIWLLGWMLWQWFAAVRAGRRGLGGSLVLTPEGVIYGWWAATAMQGWEQMALVIATVDNHGNPQLRLEPFDAVSGVPARLTGRRTRPIRLDPSLLRCDPVLLFHILDFYGRTAGARGELATGAALDRIERRAFRPTP